MLYFVYNMCRFSWNAGVIAISVHLKSNLIPFYHKKNFDGFEAELKQRRHKNGWNFAFFAMWRIFAWTCNTFLASKSPLLSNLHELSTRKKVFLQKNWKVFKIFFVSNLYCTCTVHFSFIMCDTLLSLVNLWSTSVNRIVMIIDIDNCLRRNIRVLLHFFFFTIDVSKVH